MKNRVLLELGAWGWHVPAQAITCRRKHLTGPIENESGHTCRTGALLHVGGGRATKPAIRISDAQATSTLQHPAIAASSSGDIAKGF